MRSMSEPSQWRRSDMNKASVCGSDGVGADVVAIAQGSTGRTFDVGWKTPSWYPTPVRDWG